MIRQENIASLSGESVQYKQKDIIVGGCKVTLNFLPESNRAAIDTVKKMLLSSQYVGVPKSQNNRVDLGSKL